MPEFISNPVTLAQVANFSPKQNPQRNQERVLFRARSRARTGGIIGDAYAEYLPFTPAELQGIVENYHQSSDLPAAQARVRQIRNNYDAMIRAVTGNQPIPPLRINAATPLLPNSSITDDFTRAVEYSARAIHAGIRPTEARLAANALLLRNGLDAVILFVPDRQLHADAVAAIRVDGSPTPFYQMMLDCYSESD